MMSLHRIRGLNLLLQNAERSNLVQSLTSCSVCQTSRAFAEDASARDALHGIGTPITLDLWGQRLRKDSEAQVVASALLFLFTPHISTICVAHTESAAADRKAFALLAEILVMHRQQDQLQLLVRTAQVHA